MLWDLIGGLHAQFAIRVPRTEISNLRMGQDSRFFERCEGRHFEFADALFGNFCYDFFFCRGAYLIDMEIIRKRPIIPSIISRPDLPSDRDTFEAVIFFPVSIGARWRALCL